MLDEFDVPNVEDAVIAHDDTATFASWKRIKTEIYDNIVSYRDKGCAEKTDAKQLKAEILPHISRVQSMLLSSSTDSVEMLNQLRAVEVKLSAI